jgi:hypothetical protein
MLIGGNMDIVVYANSLQIRDAKMAHGVPLWQIVPTRGADGRSLIDFMMLIPKLNKCPQPIINKTLTNLQMALEPCPDVVFVNFNLKINVLWVSLNCRPGLIFELAQSIQRLVPEAKLVSMQI